MKDEEIITLYQNRSERAIAETAEKYGAYCLTVANRILVCREDAEECVNDTWLKCWNSIPPQQPQKFSAFLAKITRNLALDKYSRATAQKRGNTALCVVFEELEECIAGGGGSPEESLEESILAGHIDRFLRSVKKRNAAIFIRRYFFAEPVSEIAATFGMSENGTAAVLSRTRKQLKKFLIQEGYSI